MVASQINPAVIFKESKTIEPEDIGHSSHVYELDVYDEKTIAVVVGKPKYTFTDKNVIYLPIYAVSGVNVRSQIGVFEIETKKLINAFRQGEIDIAKLSRPILYGFVNPSYIERLGAESKAFAVAALAKETGPEKGSEKGPEKDSDDDSDDERFKVRVPKSRVSEEKRQIESTLQTGVFAIDPDMPTIATLTEETEAVAEQYRKEYRESAKNTWIEKYMKSNHYRIDEVAGDGDCYFTCIKNAYAQIGRKTTVDKLRAILANEVSDELFQSRLHFYMHYETILKRIHTKMTGIQKNIKLLKKQMDNVSIGVDEKQKIVEKAKQEKERHDTLADERRAVERSRDDEIGYMKGIETIDQFRAYVRTQSFWADEWAISTLERILNYKTILLSEEYYKEGALDNVMKCGALSTEIESRGSFTPEFYIMVSYTGNHYDLITYREKRILKFLEIPYDIKMLVLNKCLEKNAGVYYLIQDFRNYKTKFGMDADEGRPDDYEEAEGNGDLYDDHVRFVVHARGINEKTAPGKPEGEKMPDNRVVEFVPLSKMKEWRKRLDDHWDDAELKIRGKTWASVKHYLEAAKYRVGHPAVYEQYAIESGNPAAKDIKLLKTFKPDVPVDAAGKKRIIRADVDYALGRDTEERDLALRAKFKDNADFRALLLATKNALVLRKTAINTPAEPDHLLMRIRKELQMEA